MVKVKLYSNDGKYMKEWEAYWYEWVADYRGIQLGAVKKDAKTHQYSEADEKKIIIKGGIVIIEELNEKES